jgi:hypothetical protein
VTKISGIYSPFNFIYWWCSQVLKILEIISNDLLYIVTSVFLMACIKGANYCLRYGGATMGQQAMQIYAS